MTGQTLDLQGRLNNVLDYVEVSAKQVGHFAAEQTPLLIQEILRFGLWMNIAKLVFFITTAYAILKLARSHFGRAKALQKAKKHEPFTIFGLATVFGYAPASVLLFFLILFTGRNVLEILLAPRLYIIEYAASFLHK